jgi:predicted PurR-regulated permease PerM
LFFSQVGELLDDISSIEVEATLTDIIAEIEDLLEEIPTLSEIEIDQEQLASTLLDLATAVLSSLANLALSLGTSLPNLFISGLIFVIVVATALPMWDELGARVEELSPLDVDITQIYFLKGREMIASVIKGVFLLAIIQGLIMGVFYWLAGVPFNVFWTLLSMAFAILPVVGISFIVLPMVVIFLLLGNVTSAILLLIGFYVFVNPLDLLLRPRLVSKEAYLNFTLMLLALFAGLAVGGLLGMIYGPVIMILFITTLDIYSRYFSEPKEDSAIVEENISNLESSSDTIE